MKKLSIFGLLFVSLFIITACEPKSTEEVSGETIDTSKMVHQKCIREGEVTDGEAQLQYDIYYTGDVLNLVRASEKVISSSEDVLNTYEEAYRNIHASYKGIKYYDTEVIREDDSVASIMIINYDKVDVNKIISIEGDKDNIFEDGQAKVKKWKKLAKKVGTKCIDVKEES